MQIQALMSTILPPPAVISVVPVAPMKAMLIRDTQFGSLACSMFWRCSSSPSHKHSTLRAVPAGQCLRAPTTAGCGRRTGEVLHFFVTGSLSLACVSFCFLILLVHPQGDQPCASGYHNHREPHHYRSIAARHTKVDRLAAGALQQEDEVARSG